MQFFFYLYSYHCVSYNWTIDPFLAVDRLSGLLAENDEAETPYTWGIILGGTNDLVMGTGGNDIWEALKEAYKISLQAGTRVLAATVPEWGDCSSTIDAQSDRLNSLIQSHRAIIMYAHRETILKQFPFTFKS
jgi:hypothetical protein